MLPKTVPCASSESANCQFGPEELTTLHAIGQRREYVTFPKWALSLLILILAGFFASNTAIWIAQANKAEKQDVLNTEKYLTDQNAELKVRLARLESVVPKDFPPPWFEKQFGVLLEDVRNMRNEQSEQGKMLAELRVEVRTLTNEKQQKVSDVH